MTIKGGATDGEEGIMNRR